jgi:hypothetical protein
VQAGGSAFRWHNYTEGALRVFFAKGGLTCFSSQTPSGTITDLWQGRAMRVNQP